MDVMDDTLRVLYVDDEPALLSIGKLYLEREGTFSVDTLTSADAALEQLNTARYDVIISDYLMPGMDGITFLKQLKASGNTTPFIIFTGRGREEVVIEALNSGADFYLQKGGEPKAQFKELAHKIRSAVNRERTEKRAKDTERRLYDIINFLPDATFAIDTDAKVIAWNRAIEEMTGVPARDMLGKGNYEYSIPFYGERRPILIDLVSISDEELTRGNYAIIKKEGDILIAETTLPRPLGKYSVLLGKASLLYNNEGIIIGAIESIRDITYFRKSEEELLGVNEQLSASREELEAQYNELLQSEQQLKISEEKYRVVVENSHDAIYIYRDNKFLFVNKTASNITGFTINELLNKNIWDLIHPDDRARLQEYGVRRMGGVEPSANFSARILTKTGEICYGRFFIDRIIYQGLPAILGIVKDITEQRQADDALHQSEEIYRAIFNHTGSATIIIDEDMTISFVNPEFERIIGFTKEEVEGKKYWTEFVVPEDIEQMAEYHQLRRINPMNVPKNYEFRFITRDRQVRNAYLTIGLIPGTSRTVASFVDITDNQKAQEALKESERTYRTILENIQDTYYRSDLDGNLTMMSPSGIQLLGYESESEIVGKNIATTFYADPLQRERFLQVLTRDGSVRDFEVDLRRHDGSQVTVEANSHKYYDENGNFLGVEGIFRNITERKQIMKSLAESEAKFRSIFENLQAAFYRTDRAGNLILFSDSGAKQAGYNSADEMIGLNIADVIYCDPAERSKFLAALYKDGKVDSYPLLLKTRTGRLHNILATSHLYFDDTGNVLGVDGVLHDITDQKTAEEALERKSEALSILNGIISAANKAEDLPHLLTTILEESQRWLDFDGAGIYLVDRTRRTAKIVQSINLPPEFLAEIKSAQIDKKPYDTVFLKNEPLITENYAQINPELSAKYGFQSMASIPLLSKGVVIGALNLTSLRRQIISEEEKQTLVSVGRELGSTIERMASEEEAISAKKNLETLFNSIDDLVFVLDMQGNIRAVNDAVLKRLSYTREELTGTNILLLHVPGRHGETPHIIREMIAGRIESYRVPVLAKDGTHIEVEAKVTRGWWNNEEVIIGVSRDITEHARADVALRLSNKKLTLLTGITRHDINNQLTVLLGYLELLKESKLDPSQALYLLKLTTVADRISSMIQFTKEYEDIGITEPAWQDCRTIVDTAEKDAPLGKVIIENNLPKGMEVFADPLILKVFYNLMDNAVRYGGEITTIRFVHDVMGDEYLITCEDDGNGIPDEEKERIFERGFGKHTGLGLALSREILEITGITIYENGEAGKGARFQLKVPKGAWRMNPEGIGEIGPGP